MKIRMLTIKAGPSGNANIGDVLRVPIEISAAEAQRLVEAGYAALVQEPPALETAAAPPAEETTTKPSPAPGSGKPAPPKAKGKAAKSRS